ncbi:coiled-coil domain-containing protein 90B, mitochondrial-like [Branchiostoma floridae]|uniref:Coiled-coil domain-containing protein 90B, mitochondrial-like n=1 Tax=Branchiostoma floridae TaxID=7739 RepID=A0A9J7LBD6_BRAFL|nr:coiled-coil domain-containing protein 90B, mitochondrial-like [Branchiostoma floridae]
MALPMLVLRFASHRSKSSGLRNFSGLLQITHSVSTSSEGQTAGRALSTAAVRGGHQCYHKRDVDLTPKVDRHLLFDTHTLVTRLETNGFTPEQAECVTLCLIEIMNSTLEKNQKELVSKLQQEIMMQQLMAHMSSIRKDMVILEKSEFSMLRNENDKLKGKVEQLQKTLKDDISKLKSDIALDINLEKSRTKEKESDLEKRIALTNNKIETDVAGLRTLLESSKADIIKYLAGSMLTCIAIASAFLFRLMFMK